MSGERRVTGVPPAKQFRPTIGELPMGPSQGAMKVEIAKLPPPLLGALLPMFLWVEYSGRIRGLGPTLRKVLGGGELEGTYFAEHFRIGRHSQRAENCPECKGCSKAPENCKRRLGDCGQSLLGLVSERVVHLTPKAHPEIGLRGSVLPLDGADWGGVLLDLSFGIHLRDAVATFGLTDRDFAAADLAMEMLYLLEAKALVLSELGALTNRLDTARRRAETLALTDPLTSLSNRRAMESALQRASAGAGRGGTPFSVIQIDLDHFKAVNDTFGHAAGDYVLQCVSRILREEIRAGDMAGRMGGDEFLLLMRGDYDIDQLMKLGRRLIARLEEPKWHQGNECLISGSLGVVRSQDYVPPDVERLLVDVDRATYAAKGAGRACVRVFGNLSDGD